MRVYALKLGEQTMCFAANQADARADRQRLVDNNVAKKSAIDIVEDEIPTSKPELLAFVNNLLHKSQGA